MLLLLYY